MLDIEIDGQNSDKRNCLIVSPSDGNQRTLEEVGQVFEVTRERIRQIEAKALRKLRHPSRSSHVRTFLEGSL